MTKDISSLVQTCEACELESATVSLSATFDLIVINESLSYGFCFGSTEEALDTFIDGDYLTGNSFFASVNNLVPFSKYYYKAWIEINEQKFFGEIKSFTTNGIPVNSVSLNIHDNTIHKIGEAFKLVATIVPEDASEKGLKWISSNESVAKVDDSVAKVDDEGNVTAVGNGTTQITVITNNNSKEDVCNLVVSQWVEDITLNWNNVMCHVGETPRCVATVLTLTMIHPIHLRACATPSIGGLRTAC